MRKNVLMADCEKEELKDLVTGLEKSMGIKFSVENCICNSGRSRRENIWRYFVYAAFPFSYVFHHKKYEYLICWQQFFALFYALYCEIFHLKKDNIVVACNFTYKAKKGAVGRLYKRLMARCVRSSYLDKIHVLSKNYALSCAEEFKVPIDKFIVTHFGLPDSYDRWKDSRVEYQNYSFAIGRSNRDFDFLIRAWRQMPKEELLVIASDTYMPKEQLSENIIHRRDIIGGDQFPLIAGCKLMVIPIDDGTICSGDTVLLKAMSFYKPLVVTKPSTLAEMYVEDGVNGLTVEKDVEQFTKKVGRLLADDRAMKNMGENARKTYQEKFSRTTMGENIGRCI